MTVTRPAYDKSRFSPFSNWLRDLGGVDAALSSRSVSLQNVDYIWHNYRENWLIMIEEKKYGGMKNSGAAFAQRGTLGLVAQMLERFDRRQTVLDGNREVSPHFRGFYNIVFENTCPDDGAMYIDGTLRTRDDLIYLLKTGSLPDAEEPF